MLLDVPSTHANTTCRSVRRFVSPLTEMAPVYIFSSMYYVLYDPSVCVPWL